MVQYVRIKKLIQIGSSPGQKYMCRIMRNTNISLEQICEDISQATTVSEPDALAVIKALEIFIAKYVLNGSTVKLSMLGSFSPSINATAMDTLDMVDASTIRRFKCNFRPSVAFKRNLEKVSFKEANLEIKGLQ